MSSQHKLPMLLAITLPVLVQAIWLHYNTNPPAIDAANSFRASFLIYHEAAKGHWWKFICSLYTTRDAFRPIAFHLLEVPFWLISGGNFMFTAIGLTSLCLLITCLYIYRLLCLVLDPSPAMLGTVCLGLLSGIQWPGSQFGYTEAALTPAVLAAIYHLIRSHNFYDSRQSVYFALASSMAFMLRPVEALTHLLPVYVIFLLLQWRKKTFNASQLYLIALMAMIGISVLFTMGWIDFSVTLQPLISDHKREGRYFRIISYISYMLTAFLRLGAMVRMKAITWRKNACHPPYVIPVFAAVIIIVTLFFLGFIPQLVHWIYQSSIVWEKTYPDKATYSLSSRLISFIAGIGVLPFIGITLLGILSFFLCIEKDQRRQLLRHPLLYLLATIPVTFILPLITVQYAQRKITLIFSIFLLIMMIPALTRGRWQRARTSLICLLILCQAWGLLWIYIPDFYNMKNRYAKIAAASIGAANYTSMGSQESAYEYSADAFPPMISSTPNPNIVMADFLADNAQRHGYHSIRIAVTESYPISGPLLTTLAALRTDLSFRVAPVIVGNPNIRAGEADALLLINDQAERFTQSPQEVARLKEKINASSATLNSRERISLKLLLLYAKGKMATIGAKKRECMIIQPDGNEACLFEL